MRHRLVLPLRATLLVFCAGLGLGNVHAEGELPDEQVLAKLVEAREFYKGVQDYTCVFRKQERLQDKLRKQETMLFKFQKPFRIYMKWIEEPNKGRELLFVPGKYDNKLKVHIGGFLNLFLPCITIAPDNPMVLENARHSITGAGLGNLINSLIDQFELARQQGDLKVMVHGIEKVEGEDCLKVERILPKDKGYYCHRLILYLHTAHHVPAKVMVYDGNDLLIESYSFTKIRWNTGLTDQDFDSGNKEYAFGMF